jgi:twitching motility protein PilT
MDNNFFEDVLRFGVQNNASDVHLCSGQPPVLRLLGELKRIDAPAIDKESLTRYLSQYLTEEQKGCLTSRREIDLALNLSGVSRFRVNIYQHMNGVSAAFRLIPHQIRTLDELRMPPVMKEFVQKKKGLILLTGPTGSGKSTTLAALINEVNSTRREHIITIEDPIEYIHEPNLSLIHQREASIHTVDFASALRSCLREDPDVILVGEMRDLDTITNALNAAETGHLVLSTLHTNSASETVDRIINVFPSEQQQQVRTILASSLIAVIAQRLIKMSLKKDRIALLEILAATDAAKNLIREGKTFQLPSVIQTGSEFGMRTYQKSLDELRQNNLISPDLLSAEYV